MLKKILLLSILGCINVYGMSDSMNESDRKTFLNNVVRRYIAFKSSETTNKAGYDLLNAPYPSDPSLTNFQATFLNLTDQQIAVLNEELCSAVAHPCKAFKSDEEQQGFHNQLKAISEIIIPLDMVDRKNAREKGLLHYAFFYGLTDVAYLLLKHKIFMLEGFVNDHTLNKCSCWTPLSVAAGYGYEHLVEQLIALGAKVNAGRERYCCAEHTTSPRSLALFHAKHRFAWTKEEKYQNIIAKLKAAGAIE